MEYQAIHRPTYTYSEYMDDLNYSQGFYVQEGSMIVGGIRRAEEYSDEYSRELFRKAEKAAKFAVEEHNKKAPFLLLVNIQNLNVEPTAGATYYITVSALESDGDTNYYQLKIWEKLNSGYQVQIFRRAPYSLTLSERIKQSWNCITIVGLMPWMDENYLYYKCFLAARQVLGVKVNRDSKQGYIWVKDYSDMEKIVNKYEGRKMPHSDSDVFYTFDMIL